MMIRPRYADVAATLALLVAASGGAYAATALPKDSVTTKQVKNGSLTGQDFEAGQLAAGPQGPAGPAGSTGPAGPAGPDLLRIGRQDFARQQLSDACAGVRVTTAAITVPEPAVVWLSGSGTWSYTGEDVSTPETPVLEALVLGGDGQVAGTAGAVWVGGNSAQLRSEGLVMHDGQPLVLQPGTPYRFAATFQAAGSCQTGNLDRPALSWIAYPAPR